MAGDDFKGADVDQRLVLAVQGMKMRRRVLAPEHLDDNFWMTILKNWLMVGMHGPRQAMITALSRVLNGRAGISPEMARRIEAWLGPDRGGSAELLQGLKMDYDLWVAEQRPAPKVAGAPSHRQAGGFGNIGRTKTGTQSPNRAGRSGNGVPPAGRTGGGLSGSVPRRPRLRAVLDRIFYATSN